MKSVFIVLDGIDGSGKGEMVNRLHNYLFSKNKKFRIMTTREPTYGKYGKEVREILAKEKDPKQSAEKCLDLFTKDREEHLRNTIEPFLKQNDASGLNIVICDRYYYSTIAFQHTQGLGLKLVIEKNKHFLKPDIAFILDLPVDIAIQRLLKRGDSKEKFEQKEFMEKLRENFLDLKNHLKDNIIIIDASKPIEEVFNQIKEHISQIVSG